MADDYKDASRKEAEQIKKTLIQLDALLKSDKLATMYASDASDLRAKVADLLEKFRTSLENLAQVDRDDVFKTDPTLAQRRFILIRNIESAKVEFETEAVPALAQLTDQVVEQAKVSPPAELDVSALPTPPSGEQWTVPRVVAAAERLVEQGTKAAKVAGKAYALVKALGLLVGIPIP
jgi:hypothetical protein